MGKQKVLIIKTGYTEVLDKQNHKREVSKGDAFRTTVILHAYKNDHVTWLTDEECFPLFESNPFISRLMTYDFTTRDQLLVENFDAVINLEKFPPLCALTQQIGAWRKYGFRFDAQTGDSRAYERASEAMGISIDNSAKRENKQTIQYHLFNMIGETFTGQEYVLGYQPKTKEEYDVGLNTEIGRKWPIKAWSKDNWSSLEKMIQSDGLTVTRQDSTINKKAEILTDLHRYIDWINSSKILVTNDSLGLHLALALKKKVIGLFGPTPTSEVYFYNRGEAILPEYSCEHMPCFETECKLGRSCVMDISPERVYAAVKNWGAK